MNFRILLPTVTKSQNFVVIPSSNFCDIQNFLLLYSMFPRWTKMNGVKRNYKWNVAFLCNIDPRSSSEEKCPLKNFTFSKFKNPLGLVLKLDASTLTTASSFFPTMTSCDSNSIKKFFSATGFWRIKSPLETRLIFFSRFYPTGWVSGLNEKES